MDTPRRFAQLVAGTALVVSLPAAAVEIESQNVVVGPDVNSADNAFVQPQDPALSGGGRDQTMQFGDLVLGSAADDLMIGRLGTDFFWASGGNDLIIGGTEHFNPNNRDRAFGGAGLDIFYWAPGDGSDLFFGGPGQDVVVFGLIGENEDGEVVFRVSDDQLAGDVYTNPVTNLPLVDVTNSPGFCEIIDASTSADSAAELAQLGLDHLVRFSLRGPRDAFEAGEQTDDNGLRVTLHLSDVEVLVCTSREGGEIQYFDLTVSPPQEIDLFDIDPTQRARLLSTVI